MPEHVPAADARRENAAAATHEVARRLRIENNHREKVVTFLLCGVASALIGVALLVVCLGLGWFELETPVAIALIAALAVHPFFVVGSLVRGLFGQPSPSKAPPAEVD
ncbi:hypothetical protein [Microbacterium sp. NPDC058389]|uniref:hypothetical protein n=1 Tax=Microbacterium sp. NPDC058389 TaxID=3346475 RepID=UPI00365A2532